MSAVAALRQRLTHQTYVDVPDGAGGVTRTFVAIGQVWGAVETLSSDFAVSEEQARAGHAVRVTLRQPHAVTVGDRLLLGARLLHVEAVSDADGRGRFARCRCREEQP